MANIQIRVDDGLRAEAQAVAEGLGMDLTTAIRVFLKQLVTENALPFRPARDPFYTPANIEVLSRRFQESKAGINTVQHGLLGDAE